MGRQFPPAGGTGPIARRADGCGVPRPRISALRFPLLGLRRVRTQNLARQPAGMRRAATLRHGSTTYGDATMPELKKMAQGERRVLAKRTQGPAKFVLAERTRGS